MSSNYSFRLMCNREDVSSLLESTFSFCTTFSINTVEFPGGTSISGPFNAGISVGRRHLFKGRIPNIKLPTAMTFDTDEYLHKTNFAQGSYTTIEIVYVEIFLGDRYALVNYKASNSKISRLFANSSSIKSTFRNLAEDNRCLLAMFDKGDANCYLLDETSTSIPSIRNFRPNPIFEKPDRLDFYIESFLTNAVST